MTLRHGRNCSIYLNGVDISGDLNEINPTSEQELADVTTFGCAGHTFYPGLAKDTGTISGIYSSTSQTVINALKQTDPGYAMMIAFGQSIGDPAYCCNEVMLMNHSIKSVVTDVNRISFNFDVDNYPFEPGNMLTPGLKTVTTSGTSYGTGVDGGGLSGTTGGTIYVQVPTVNGASTGALFIDIQHSSTGAFAGEESAWYSFAGLTTSYIARIRETDQIKQYTRIKFINSTASTPQVALALTRY